MNKTSILLVPWRKEYISGTPHGELHTTPPRIIYRYLPINRVDSLIQNAQLYFAPPKSFNDPFDMHTGLLDFSTDKSSIVAFVDRAFYDKPKKERKLIYNIYMTQPGQYLKGIIEGYERLRSSMGVCCFSKRPDVGLMWSHYTGSHTGMAFGFNIGPFPTITQEPLIQPVKYMDKISPMKVDSNGVTDYNSIGHWVLTKSKMWEYEEEVRAILQYQNGLVKFNKACLKEVYFGCMVLDDEIKRIVSLLNNNGYSSVKCFKMIIDTSIFNVVPIELDVFV